MPVAAQRNETLKIRDNHLIILFIERFPTGYVFKLCGARVFRLGTLDAGIFGVNNKCRAVFSGSISIVP